MSDPRWNIGDKRLPPIRQDGYATGDTVDPDTETKRRLKQVANAPKVKDQTPLARTVKPDTSATPIEIPPPDRWHKKSLSYITVSKQDFNDPIADASQFSSVAAAIGYAQTVIAPLLTNPDTERIVIEIHDGLYEEDVILTSGFIDLEGVGRPILRGNHRIIHGTSNKVLIRDIEMWGPDNVDLLPALYIETFSDYPASARTFVEIDRCYIHGAWGAIYCAGTRIDLLRSMLETDFIDTDYANIDTPTLEFLQIVSGYVEVRDTYIAGLMDLRSPVLAAGWPNYGMAIRLTGADVSWAKTGVVFRNCTVTGYCVNYIWNIIFNHCDLYAGKKHATAGTKFMIVYGDSDTGIHGACTYNHCGISTRYIAEEIDIGMTPTNGIVDEYVQFTKQLSYDAYDTSADPLGQTIFGNMLGNTNVVHSATWRQYWNFNGVGEGAVVVVNSDNSVPISAMVSDYIHW